MNCFQRERFAKNIVNSMFSSLLGKKLGILGFAFKADTGDTRESAAIYVCNSLFHEGAILHIYDPKVTEEQIFFDLGNINPALTREKFEKSVKVFSEPYAALKETHAVIVLTEWPEFRTLDYSQIYGSMQKPAFCFDGRNILNRKQLRKIGFCTHSIGSRADTLLD
jgi:UDPglucose 6-dehydrogenase